MSGAGQSVHEQFNFPAGLAVFPSSSPSSFVTARAVDDATADLAGGLSIPKLPDVTAAEKSVHVKQDIDGYGIAGRIWSVGCPTTPTICICDHACVLTSPVLLGWNLKGSGIRSSNILRPTSLSQFRPTMLSAAA